MGHVVDYEFRRKGLKRKEGHIAGGSYEEWVILYVGGIMKGGSY